MNLAKLKALEAKASPAPWWQDAVDCEDGHGHYKAYCVGYEHKSILDTSNSDVQLIEQDDGPRYDITGHYDTEFIAEMRNATPQLIARIEMLEEGLRAIRYTLQNEAVLSTDAGTKIVITHLINICTETLEGK